MNKRGGLFSLLFVFIALTVSSQTADQLFQTGRGAFGDELFPLAAENFRLLAEQYPDHALADDAVYLLGIADYYLGNYRSTLSVFQRFETVYRGSPFISKVNYWLGGSYFHLGRFDEAVLSLGQQIDRYPSEAFTEHALMLKAAALEKLQRWREAQKSYEQVSVDSEDFYPEALFRSGAISLRYQNYQQALSTFRTILVEYSDSLLVPEALFFSAECLYALDRLAQAGKSYQQVLENNPETGHRESCLYRLTQINTQLGQAEAALYWAETLERDFSAGIYREELPRMKADLLFDLKRFDESARLYQLALDLSVNPEDKQAVAYNLGLSQYLRGRKREAVAALSLAASGQNETARKSLFQLGISRMELGQDVQAAADFENYLRRFPGAQETEETLRLLGAVYERSGKHQQAYDIFTRLLTYYTDSGNFDEYLFRRGSSALSRGESSTALKDFFRLRQEFAKSEYWVQSTYNIGFIYSERGEFIRALPFFDEIGDGDGDLAQRAQLAGGTCLFNAGKYEAAARRFSELTVKFGSWSGEGWFYLGRTQYRQEQLVEAAESFRKASRLLQGNEVGAESLYWRGLSFFRLDRLQEAQQAFVALAADYPQGQRLAEAYYRAGLCALGLEQFSLGLDYFRKAESNNGLPQILRADVLYQKGFTLYALERSEEAVEVFEDLFRDFPGSPLAQEGFYKLAEQEYVQGRFETALTWFTRARELAPESATGRSALYWTAASTAGLERDRQALALYLDYLLLGPDDNLDQAAVDEIRRILSASSDQRLVRRFYSEVIENPQVSTALKTQVRFEYARRLFERDVDQAYQIFVDLRREGLDNPLRSEVDFMIGRYYLESGDLDRASEVFVGIAAGQAGVLGARAQLKIAEVREQQDEPRLAAEEFLKVYFIYPDERQPAAEGLFRAASLYRRLGDDENAGNLFAKLRSEFPESTLIEQIPE